MGKSNVRPIDLGGKHVTLRNESGSIIVLFSFSVAQPAVEFGIVIVERQVGE